MLRVTASGFTGTALEYYDFFLYGTASALVFGPLFFPSYSPLAGTLASFATFAVGFLARPIGSLLFGNLGDRVGRRKTLVYSLLLMGSATTLIGALPTFDTAGWLAPAMLVLLRILQGIAMGGEWGGASLMLVEHAPKKYRGLFGSTVQMGVPGGLMLSTVAVSLSDHYTGAAFETWGWRIPFLLSAVVFAVSMVIRLGVDETPVFTALESEDRVDTPIRTLLTNNWRQLVLSAVIIAPGGVLFYLVSTYTVAYGTTVVGLDRSTMLDLILAASAVYMVAIPVAGYLSDVISRQAVLVFGCLAACAGGFALFALIDTGSTVGAFLGITFALAVIHSSLQAPQPAFLAAQFPARVRMSGVALSQSVSTSVVGGTAPLLATLFYSWTESAVLISVWLAMWGIAGAAATLVLVRLAKASVPASKRTSRVQDDIGEEERADVS